jgi:hypothetical protein
VTEKTGSSHATAWRRRETGARLYFVFTLPPPVVYRSFRCRVLDLLRFHYIRVKRNKPRTAVGSLANADCCRVGMGDRGWWKRAARAPAKPALKRAAGSTAARLHPLVPPSSGSLCPRMSEWATFASFLWVLRGQVDGRTDGPLRGNGRYC